MLMKRIEVDFYDRSERDRTGNETYYNNRIARVDVETGDEATVLSALHKQGFRPKKVIKLREVESNATIA